MNTAEAKLALEAALFCSAEPLTLRAMKEIFDGVIGADTLRHLLDEISRDYADRAVELVSVASGWRFQSRPQFQPYINKLNPERTPTYSRAVMETLAIIVYRQPVTRGDIEDIRGVTVSSSVIGQLEERGWIEEVGTRDSPGRPTLFATTRQFLDDLGLTSLDQMPTIEPVTLAAALGGEATEGAEQEGVAIPEGQPVDVVPEEVAEPREERTQAQEGHEIAVEETPTPVEASPVAGDEAAEIPEDHG